MIRSNLHRLLCALGPILIASGTASGCAASLPAELASARVAYSDASSGPAATLVPAELHKAHEALELAEAAFKDDPHGFQTLDLAYVAQRKAELAMALADSATARGSSDAANSEYQATQDAIMRDTKAQLGTTKSDLASTQSIAAQTAAELGTTRSDLTNSQAANAKAGEDLTASEAARAAAEARADDALAALAKLASIKEETRGLVITLSGSVLFRSDEATLLPEAQSRLGDVAKALLATSDRTLLVEGHTDSQGSDDHNLDLSRRRAEAVRTFLAARGYDAARIRAVGIGEARPVADNATAEGRANNRRVEIVVENPVAQAR